MEEQQEKTATATTFSKPAAYGTLAATTAGIVGLSVIAPTAVTAGMGSVSTSSAVFITPVWRLIKRVNTLYNDTGHYIKTDIQRFRNKYINKIDLAAAGEAAETPPDSYKPVHSRKTVYGLMALTGLVSGGLLFYAPTALAAAAGAVAVSGASFTKPVIDLVQKVNELYIDTYNYIKGDLSRGKKLKINLPAPQNEKSEIDHSISAPFSPAEEKAKWSKLEAYGIMAAATVGVALLAVHFPAVLVAALGTVMGSAISYTQPALKLVKKINKIYDHAETQVANDFNIAEELGLKPKAQPEQAPSGLKKFARQTASYLFMGGLVTAGVLMAIYTPSLLTAAVGSIAGAASSFTSPVLKQVGKVNDFYMDVGNYLRDDWKRIFKPRAPKPDLEQTAGAPAPENALKPEEPKAQTPQPAPKPDGKEATEAFNTVAEKPARETQPETPAVKPRREQSPLQTEFNEKGKPGATPAKKPLKKPLEADNDNAPEEQEGAVATARAKNKPQPPVKKP
ncbi:MAG: hypothetical protein GC185_00635 [Alphaproteobacteria bacterium]|nr:hypothetical protein [Alphaproteobacteria bacterium]